MTSDNLIFCRSFNSYIYIYVHDHNIILEVTIYHFRIFTTANPDFTIV